MPPAVLLITGAAGNFGRKLTAHFRSKGYRLVLLDIVTQPAESGIEVADLSSWGGWADRFDGVDCVIHLAADRRVEADWGSVTPDNIDATLNVFEAASRHGVKRVVFASSIWVMKGYGESPSTIAEDLPPMPVNAYGASKLAGERIGRFFSEARGLSAICFRPGACLPGPDNRPGRRLGDISWEQRIWLSDRDLCRAFELAVEAPDTIRFEIFNLVSDNRGMRWDMSKAERLLGFSAQDTSVSVPPPLRRRIARWLRKVLAPRWPSRELR